MPAFLQEQWRSLQACSEGLKPETWEQNLSLFNAVSYVKLTTLPAAAVLVHGHGHVQIVFLAGLGDVLSVIPIRVSVDLVALI